LFCFPPPFLIYGLSHVAVCFFRLGFYRLFAFLSLLRVLEIADGVLAPVLFFLILLRLKVCFLLGRCACCEAFLEGLSGRGLGFGRIGFVRDFYGFGILGFWGLKLYAIALFEGIFDLFL
jgi:hypothetical protein